MQRQYVRIDLQDLEGVDIVDFKSKRESASLIWSYRSDRRAAGTWLSYLLRQAVHGSTIKTSVHESQLSKSSGRKNHSRRLGRLMPTGELDETQSHRPRVKYEFIEAMCLPFEDSDDKGVIE